MGARSGGLALLCAAAMALCMAFCRFYGDLRGDAFAYAAAAVAATSLLYLFYLFLRKKEIRPGLRHILLVAALLRLLAFPQPPSLSDDAWRYLWDGRLTAEGINPYHYVPADPALASYHDDLFRLQGYPETNTIYPPGAQLIFAGAVSLGAPFGSDPLLLFYLYKLLLVAADLLAVYLLLRMLEKLRRPLAGAILYAWHPLVIVELAGQGHTDAFWVLATGLALYGFLFRTAGSGLPALGFGAAVRLFPLLVMPLWLRFAERGKRMVALLSALPFLLLLVPLLDPEALRRYSTVAARFTNYYEFNGGAYFAVKGLLDAARVSPSNTIAGAIITGLLLAGAAVITLRPLRRRTFSALLASAAAVVTLQIILSAKVHIWYFVLPLYLLAFRPDRPLSRAWLWAALVAPLTYLYYAVEPNRELMWVVVAEWGGFALLWSAGVVAERQKKRREKREENEERPTHV